MSDLYLVKDTIYTIYYIYTLTPVLPGHGVQPEHAGVGLQAASSRGLPGEARRGRATGLGEGASTSQGVHRVQGYNSVHNILLILSCTTL